MAVYVRWSFNSFPNDQDLSAALNFWYENRIQNVVSS